MAFVSYKLRPHIHKPWAFLFLFFCRLTYYLFFCSLFQKSKLKKQGRLAKRNRCCKSSQLVLQKYLIGLCHLSISISVFCWWSGIYFSGLPLAEMFSVMNAEMSLDNFLNHSLGLNSPLNELYKQDSC